MIRGKYMPNSVGDFITEHANTGNFPLESLRVKTPANRALWL